MTTPTEWAPYAPLVSSSQTATKQQVGYRLSQWSIELPDLPLLVVRIPTCRLRQVSHPNIWKEYPEVYECKSTDRNGEKTWTKVQGHTYVTGLWTASMEIGLCCGWSYPWFRIGGSGGAVSRFDASGCTNGQGWRDLVSDRPSLVSPESAEELEKLLRYAAPITPSHAHLVPLSPVEKQANERRWLSDHANDWVVVSAFGSWLKTIPVGYVGVAAIQASELPPGRRTGIERRWFLVPEQEYAARGDAYFLVDLNRHQPWINHP